MTAGLLALSVAAAIPAGLVHRDQGPHPTDDPGKPSSTAQPAAMPPVTDEQLRRLPDTTTDTTLATAPTDDRPDGPTSGVVAHNRRPLPVFTAPGGSPFARLPVRQLGNDTWLPVIAEQPGWVRVLLPSRPNGSTGWLPVSQLTLTHTPYDIRVDLSAARLHLARTSASPPFGGIGTR